MNICPFAGEGGCECEGAGTFHEVHHVLVLLRAETCIFGGLAAEEESGTCRMKEGGVGCPAVCGAQCHLA